MKITGSKGASVKQLDDGIFLIPGRKSGGCNVFVLKGTHKVAMIDTGMPGNRDAIAAGLAEIGLGFDDVGIVVLTHEHIDHVGGLPDLPSHIIVAAHARVANKLQLGDEFSTMSGLFSVNMRSSHVDIHLEDGSLIDLGGLRLRTIYTPGHCSGAICLYEPGRGALFTADTIFAGGILGGIFASGNIGDYIESLERLREFRLVSLYPGHGRMSANPAEDLERAIQGSALLMSDTRHLFESINTKGAFDQIMRGTVDYSRRAAERRKEPRMPSEIKALLRLDDADHPVTVQNISMTGVQLDREISAAKGATVLLALDAIGTLECEVVANIGGHARLSFLQSARNHENLATWLREQRPGTRQ